MSKKRNHSRGPCLIFFVGRDSYFLSHRLPAARAAIAQGYDVHVIAGNSGLGEVIKATGVRFHPRWMSQDKFPALTVLVGLLQLLFLGVTKRARIIHIVGLRYALIGLIVSICLPWTRFIFSINGLGFLFLKANPKMIYRLTRRVTTSIFTIVATLRKIEIIFQNNDDLELFCQATTLRQASIHLIPGSGVDTEQYGATPLPARKKFIFGVACRMIRMKGIEDIIAAARSMIDDGLPITLRLAGDVDEANPDSLKADDIQRFCKDGEIEWFGYLSDMTAFWSDCHVAMLGSHGGEGVPMSLLIPAAMQRPIICSDTSGNRDMVKEGINGYLYPAGDVHALKDVMKLILDKDLKKMGLASRIIVHEQGMDASSIHRQFVELY